MKFARIFAFWFLAEFTLYALIVANGRAYTHALYVPTVLSDGLIQAFNFFVGVKFIEGKDNRTKPALFGSILGGMCGSAFSILVTTRVYGQ